ncbi:DNA-binding MarR family transcriptional regulator [Chitinophaga skermanii]|uniref:DNA-binding MarR family transcriptional regulator n=1 Tax=Chitinophaga skermanii TaxID=331697 RepID=A0A327QDB6_9BACT|nr:MarR family winged helix-turn-helix transcriptional regulator [Chitinophaga skermanii]RAJ02470.1 DNA-binding MarR family transcriptional regulator [Chitinophaga skermanii]
MSFYPTLGYLVFGTRLRRLSEYFLAEVNKVYEQQGIAFDASWFPVFYLVANHPEPPTLMDMATQLEVSHSAVSQLVTNLKSKGLVKTSKCKDDGRRQLVVLTKKGTEMLATVQPIWDAIAQAMENLSDEGAHSKLVLQAVAEIEQAVEKTSLSERILTAMHTRK